ncbi:MAG TPA: hypothetical protein VFB19_10515 [Mycobacterium sp.]|nr:hypothetical protein [Mycobacterium sp.]
MTVDVCPACGYPTVGPGPCFFCLPVVATPDDQPYEDSTPTPGPVATAG